MGIDFTAIFASIVAVLGVLCGAMFRWALKERDRRATAENKTRNLEQHISHGRRVYDASEQAKIEADRKVQETRENPRENFPFDKQRD